jgi:tetratricopeptide (TPR) repeat protein
MRRFLLLAAMAASFPLAAIAQADRGGQPQATDRVRPAPDRPGSPGDGTTKPEAGKAEPSKRVETSLDALFERLAKSTDADEAKGIVYLIERRWLRSGSDTADLLMSRALEAIQAKDLALGVELLDRVLDLQPKWAEAWNRRAVVFYMLDDPIAAIADLNRALALEPRHFGAWTGLGHILKASGNDRAALASYERALAVNPQLENLPDLVSSLRRQVQGVDL